MTDEAGIVFVDGLRKMLGRTEASISARTSRGAPWLPKGFKIAIRHRWLIEDVREFLRTYRDNAYSIINAWAEAQISAQTTICVVRFNFIFLNKPRSDPLQSGLIRSE